MKISEEYLNTQKEAHKDPEYGRNSIQFSGMVADVIRHFKIKTVSDYGAGKRRLLEALNFLGLNDFQYYPYDPAYPEYGEPQPAQLVCCIDVLEHIEPDCLDDVLEDLRNITTGIGFFTVHMGPAERFLSDGRNAHLIQKPKEWWLKLIGEKFLIIDHRTDENDIGFIVMVIRKEINN